MCLCLCLCLCVSVCVSVCLCVCVSIFLVIGPCLSCSILSGVARWNVERFGVGEGGGGGAWEDEGQGCSGVEWETGDNRKAGLKTGKVARNEDGNE